MGSSASRPGLSADDLFGRGSLLLIGPDDHAAPTLAMLHSAGFTARHCLASLHAIINAVAWSPNLLLLDCRSNSALGIQLCRSLRAVPETARVPVIALIPGDDRDARVQALEAGADDCLDQPVNARESVLRIRASQRRSAPPADDGVLRVGDLELDLDRYRVRRAGHSVPVTSMQFRLLRHLMEHPATIFTRERLLSELWGDSGLDEGAVTAGIVRLRRALGAVGGPELIRSVRGQGYLFDCEARSSTVGR